MRKAGALKLSPEQRRQLEAWAWDEVAQARLAERARILLSLANGCGVRPTAETFGVTANTVRRWRARFLERGCIGIEHEAPGRGRKPQFDGNFRAEIIRKTIQETPSEATHWSLRSMAKATGVSQFLVWRIWQEHGLKPHRGRPAPPEGD